jgi:putative oxidoreductase
MGKTKMSPLVSRLLNGVVPLLVRFSIGGIFIVAGVLKAFDPAQFLLDIQTFQLFSYPLAYATAIFLPWIEIWIGCAIIVRRAYTGALILGLIMMLMFIAIFIQSWARGLDVNCGCFGKDDSNTTSYSLFFTRNSIIFLSLIWLLLQDQITVVKKIYVKK